MLVRIGGTVGGMVASRENFGRWVLASGRVGVERR